jgi:hypothetical protein
MTTKPKKQTATKPETETETPPTEHPLGLVVVTY